MSVVASMRVPAGRGPDGAQVPAAVARSLLGWHLREQRERAELKLSHVGRALFCSEAKVSRIECGMRQIDAGDLDALLDLYRVDELMRARVRAWAAAARGRSVYHAFGDAAGPAMRRYLDLEAGCSALDIYQPMEIPAVLRTAAYTAAVHQGVDDGRAAWAGALSALRGRHVLSGGARLRVVLASGCVEALSHGDAVMRGQYKTLRHVGSSRLQIRVLPFAAGPVDARCMAGFSLLEIPGAAPPLVGLDEGRRGVQVHWDRSGEYRALFAGIWAAAEGLADRFDQA